MKLRFDKWEGLGNDFIVVDAATLTRELQDNEIRWLCDRRRGVGGDGVLLVEASEGVAGKMIVRNADASRPEMCGNGIRCVAGHLLGGSSGGASLVIRTDSGDRGCAVSVSAEGEVEVEVEMGNARFDDDLEVTLPDLSGAPAVHRFGVVNMGNPHAITFEPYTPSAFGIIAPIVEKTPVGGTNVELVHVEPAELQVRVWERGVGYTDACGTGACAVAALACKRGLARFDQDVSVRLPGGPLVIRVSETQHSVSMRGPARRVFRGEVQLA